MRFFLAIASSAPEAANYPCGTTDRASPVCELRSLPSGPCVRRRPCSAWFWVQRVRVRCTPGSGWQSRAYLASARILQSKPRRFGSENPWPRYDTTSLKRGSLGSQQDFWRDFFSQQPSTGVFPTIHLRNGGGTMRRFKSLKHTHSVHKRF